MASTTSSGSSDLLIPEVRTSATSSFSAPMISPSRSALLMPQIQNLTKIPSASFWLHPIAFARFRSFPPITCSCTLIHAIFNHHSFYTLAIKAFNVIGLLSTRVSRQQSHSSQRSGSTCPVFTLITRGRFALTISSASFR